MESHFGEESAAEVQSSDRLAASSGQPDRESAAASPRDGWRYALWAVVKVLACLGVVYLVGGIGADLTLDATRAALRTQCLNNLKTIGLALENYHGANNCYPAGTLANADLPPEKRLSWQFVIIPYVESGDEYLIDESKAWDAPVNRQVLRRRRLDDGEAIKEFEEPAGAPGVYHCRGGPYRSQPNLPSITNYVGVAGLGEAAAELSSTDDRAGFFGYDRKITKQDIRGALSSTLVAIEAADGGPWTAGGNATVRSLVNDGRPYLGENNQFGGLHPMTGTFSLTRSGRTIVLCVDASTTTLSDSTSPEILESMATLKGPGKELDH
jgi:hypothetical protein